MPEFAVVIPTRGRPDLLAEAVSSVLGQTHPAAEVVVVADGRDTVVPAGIVTGPVSVVTQDRAGPATARNTGIAATRSPWVCFLDDDDLFHPRRLELAARHLDDHPDCRALTTSSWCFSTRPGAGIDLVADDLAGCLEAATRTEPVTDMSYLDITGRSFDLLLERNRGNISGSTVRRDVLEQAGGFPDGYTCAEDWVMCINVARYAEWCYLDERLSFVRRHVGNNTSANPRNGLTTVRALQEVWDDRSRPAPPHRELAGYGPLYRWSIQGSVWLSLRTRRFGLAWETLRAGRALLPRWRDRAYVLVPPPVTWRIEHLPGRRTR